MSEVSLEQLKTVLDARFGGLLRKGKHPEDSHACALELLSAVQEIPWTDSPSAVRTFDLRPINDIPISDEVRTQALLPVLARYAGSSAWPRQRQQLVVNRLIILTVNRLIADLPFLSETIRRSCQEAKTLKEAEEAEWAAWEAARSAAWAARAAEGMEQVFRSACSLWMEACTDDYGKGKGDSSNAMGGWSRSRREILG